MNSPKGISPKPAGDRAHTGKWATLANTLWQCRRGAAEWCQNEKKTKKRPPMQGPSVLMLARPGVMMVAKRRTNSGKQWTKGERRADEQRQAADEGRTD
jgi:hypothetical protein